MDKIIITKSNPNLDLPDFTKTFANDLKDLVLTIKSKKEANFHLANELGFTMVYYAVELCFEFQTKGDGTVPENIKDSIIKQVISASETFARTDDDFKKIIVEKFNYVIENPLIVQEAKDFLDNIRNNY